MNGFTNGFGSGGMMGYGYMYLVPIAIIAVLFFLFRSRDIKGPTAQNILDKRYANGGISEEEYREKSVQIRETHKELSR